MPEGRLTTILMTAVLTFAGVAVHAAPPDGPSGRIFQWQHARQARELARTECKPLVVHFVPDSRVGQRQLQSFYARADGVPREMLDGVVIIVVPTNRFRGFAQQLGITGAGGYRTISAYDLSLLDAESRPTCRSGFV